MEEIDITIYTPKIGMSCLQNNNPISSSSCLTNTHQCTAGPYRHPFVQTPHMDRLAEDGATFTNAYCNSPLCMPSRMSFMTGRYIHKIGAWDNAAPLRPDAITWAHLLRSVGYDVVLSGKQHFGGMDQLHGFRTQLARDLHAERQHGLTDWDNGTPPANRPWQGLAQARPGTTEEIQVDDLVEAEALTYLRDPARHEQPWALNVSFIAPPFPARGTPTVLGPFTPLEEIDLPDIPEGHPSKTNPPRLPTNATHVRLCGFP